MPVIERCPECDRPVGEWHVANCAAMRPDGTQGMRVQAAAPAMTATERAAAQLREWGHQPDEDALRRMIAFAPVRLKVPLWQWLVRFWIEHPEER